MKTFRYFQDTRLIFGAGTVSEAGKVVSEFGNTCLLVSTAVSDKRKALYERVIGILERSKLKVTHFDGVKPNPSTEEITAGGELAKSINADVIVGLGGGSSMDAAKAIAVEASHEGSSWDYLFYKKQPTNKTLPVVAISTTSGTGSHVTQVSVITHKGRRDKSALYNEFLYPRVSIVDPELMRSIPQHITATTGFDALSHSFESLLHPNCGAYVELMAREAIKVIAKQLPLVFKDPENLESRSALAWADTLAGYCIANAGVTLPHGIGMAIGGMYPHVAHGDALSIVYPACLDYTWDHAIKQHAYLANTLNPGLTGLDTEVASRVTEEVIKFMDNLGLYRKLSDVNVPKEEIQDLARQSMVLPDYMNNPRVPTYSEIIDLLNASY